MWLFILGKRIMSHNPILIRNFNPKERRLTVAAQNHVEAVGGEVLPNLKFASVAGVYLTASRTAIAPD